MCIVISVQLLNPERIIKMISPHVSRGEVSCTLTDTIQGIIPRVMDVESGSCRSGRSSQSVGATGRLSAAVSIFVSCVALAGVLVLLMQNQRMEADMKQLSSPKTARAPDSAHQERALEEEHQRFVRGSATATSYACQYNRRNPDYHKDCTDSPQTPDSIPSAHIVPDGSMYPCNITDPAPFFYSIISVGWSCGATHDRIPLPGFVRGGMTFDRDTGALKVPVEGIYFVYSQAHVNISNPSNVVLAGTQTFICEEEGCRSTVYLSSQTLTDITYGPFYHGGLFHLNANSTIKIAAWYDASIGRERNSHADSVAYTAYFANTFMGAFLVEEILPC